MSREVPGKPVSEADVAELLESISDENVTFQITFPEKRAFPKMEADFDTLSASSSHDVEAVTHAVSQLFERSKKYLQRPLLTDTFPDHSARRAWQTRATADPRVGKIYTPFQNENKLRYNNIGDLVEMTYALTLYLSSKGGKVEWSKKDAVLALLNEFPDMKDYADIDLPTKLERVRQLDEFCDKFIALVSAGSSE